MAKNRSRAERSAARQRYVEKQEHAKRFAESFKHSLEKRQLATTTNSSIIEHENSYSLRDIPDVKRSIRFYRFKGITTEQGLFISDQPERWQLIDEMQSELEKLEQAKSLNRKGKAQQRRIEQLATLIEMVNQN